jgi:predicted patatin/cPLA2 family phospholipase
MDKSYFGNDIYNNKLHGWNLSCDLKEWKDLYSTAHKTGEVELAEIFDYLLTRIYIAESKNVG